MVLSDTTMKEPSTPPSVSTISSSLSSSDGMIFPFSSSKGTFYPFTLFLNILLPRDQTLWQYGYRILPYLLILFGVPVLYVLFSKTIYRLGSASIRIFFRSILIPLFTSPNYLQRARISGLITIVAFLSWLMVLLSFRQLLYLGLFLTFLALTLYFRLQHFRRYGFAGTVKIQELRQRLLYGNPNNQVTNTLVNFTDEDHSTVITDNVDNSSTLLSHQQDDHHHHHADPLYSMRLLDWLRDDSLSKKIAPYVPFILNMDNEEVQIYLQSAPPAIRNTLLRPGLIHLLPSNLVKLFIGEEGIHILDQQKQDFEVLLSIGDTLNNNTTTSSVIQNNNNSLPYVPSLSLRNGNPEEENVGYHTINMGNNSTTNETIVRPIRTSISVTDAPLSPVPVPDLDSSIVMGTPRTVLASPLPITSVPSHHTISRNTTVHPHRSVQPIPSPSSLSEPPVSERWSHDLMRYVIQRRLALQIDQRLSHIGLSTGKLLDISVLSTGITVLLSTVFRQRFQKGFPLTIRKLAFGLTLLFWLLYFLRSRAKKVLRLPNVSNPVHPNFPHQTTVTRLSRNRYNLPLQPRELIGSPLQNVANLVSQRLGIPSPLPPIASLLSSPIQHQFLPTVSYNNPSTITSSLPDNQGEQNNIPYQHHRTNVAYIPPSPVSSTLNANTVNSLIHYAHQQYPSETNNSTNTPRNIPSSTVTERSRTDGKLQTRETRSTVNTIQKPIHTVEKLVSAAKIASIATPSSVNASSRSSPTLPSNLYDSGRIVHSSIPSSNSTNNANINTQTVKLSDSMIQTPKINLTLDNDNNILSPIEEVGHDGIRHRHNHRTVQSTSATTTTAMPSSEDSDGLVGSGSHTD